MKNTHILALSTLCLALTSALPARAVDVNITGRLTEAAPCTINNGTNIEVDFGEVAEMDVVNGTIAKILQPVQLNLDCSGGAGRLVKLTVIGVGLPNKTTAVTTNITALGVQFYSDATGTTKFDLNDTTGYSWMAGTNDPTTFSAKLVTTDTNGSVLKGGAFTGIATLVSAYQ